MSGFETAIQFNFQIVLEVTSSLSLYVNVMIKVTRPVKRRSFLVLSLTCCFVQMQITMEFANAF